ncbi:MAG: leucyl/phenylalanyl-tRNA--protein transferase [Campylobacterota bacterium]|nr:leucyl/phenylalanyl-tRNA--protein transferase [Campylobacterota bacterium]
MYIPEIDTNNFNFPDPRNANEDGIVAWGGNLHPLRLIRAYQSGIFPWYSKGQPILWWSTDPRLIMDFQDFKISRSLKKSIRKFEYKFNTQFTEVMNSCATTPRNDQAGTWIGSDVIKAYTALHNMGIANSIESYQDGKLVGGLYGLVIGKVFCGESMFSHVSDASKSAYAVLIEHLKKWNYDFIDCQVPTKHLKSLGAKEITREQFLERLEISAKANTHHQWQIDPLILKEFMNN